MPRAGDRVLIGNTGVYTTCYSDRPGGPGGAAAGVGLPQVPGSWPGRRRTTPLRRWQAGHTSWPTASAHQPAATALTRLSASPSAAGSANRVPQPAISHQAAGTRI
jgi:hypothetical protein